MRGNAAAENHTSLKAYKVTRIAFKMKLYPGREEEYRRRHEAIWPELAQLLRQSGIADYSIFLDRDTGDLFGVMQVSDLAAYEKLPEQPLMRRWWDYMKDLMETHPDHSPLSLPLQEVFYLP